MTLLAQWLRLLCSVHKLASSNPDTQLFAFVFYVHKDLNLYIQCMYLVRTLYEQCLNKYVHEHGCKYKVYVYILGLNIE
jgi:hypothetical protein